FPIMKKSTSLALWLALSSLLSTGAGFSATVSVTDGDANNYGNTDGFAIDFDATPLATVPWAPALVEGSVYTLDRVSVFERNSFNADFYLGVYTGLTGTTPSGFPGTSENTLNFSNSDNATVDWTFSGITVVP